MIYIPVPSQEPVIQWMSLFYVQVLIGLDFILILSITVKKNLKIICLRTSLNIINEFMKKVLKTV